MNPCIELKVNSACHCVPIDSRFVTVEAIDFKYNEKISPLGDKIRTITYKNLQTGHEHTNPICSSRADGQIKLEFTFKNGEKKELVFDRSDTSELANFFDEYRNNGYELIPESNLETIGEDDLLDI